MLLEHEYVQPLVGQLGGAHQARVAGTHDHGVHVEGLLSVHVGLGHLGAEVGQVVAGLLDGLLHGAFDGHRRDGAAAQVGNVHALVLDDRGGDAGAGEAADADGLLVAEHPALGDGALAQGRGHVDVVLVAHGLGHVAAVAGHGRRVDHAVEAHDLLDGGGRLLLGGVARRGYLAKNAKGCRPGYPQGALLDEGAAGDGVRGFHGFPFRC